MLIKAAVRCQAIPASRSNLPLGAVKGIPDTSHALIDTANGLGDAPQLVATGVAQQRRLFQDLARLEVAHANGLFPTVDVAALDDGVLVGPWRDGDFDLWVLGCEAWEGVFKEGTVREVGLVVVVVVDIGGG